MSDNWGIGFFQRLEDQKLEKKMNDKIEELENMLDLISHELQELKKQEQEVQKDWPQVDDLCWTYDSYGRTYTFTFRDNDLFLRRKENHMCFRAKKEAQLSCRRGLAYRMLWDMADGGCYGIHKETYDAPYEIVSSMYVWGVPRFSSTKKAQEAIDTIGTELLDTIFDGEQK